MNYLKTIILSKERIYALIKLTVLISIATVAPLFHSQPITGPIVNAALFISVILLGTEAAVFVALIPSMIALSVGLLPPVLAPMVPFIMMGNIIMITTFAYLRKKNFWLGMISASVIKFLFLFLTSSVVINLLLKKEVAVKVAAMMSWPQLLTALAGGLIAYGFLKIVKRV